jgi:tetratricopeptide (TPR) repeat protein
MNYSRKTVPSLLACLLAVLSASAACGQINPQSKAVPGDLYLLSFAPYYEGDFGTAKKAFQDSARGGVRNVDGRWVDSICYHTMVGECFYQLGNRADALEQYTSALQLFVAHQNWLGRVSFPPSIDAASSSNLASVTWGKPGRAMLIGNIPDRMTIEQGRLDNSSVLQRGGVVSPLQYVPVRVGEVVRCTALAIARRREIMGPVCQHDPLTNSVLTALTSRPAPPNHWSQAWISVQLGMAYASAGKNTEAVAELTKGLQIADRFDHVLTALALVELGKLAFAEQKYDAAATMFYEATFPAAAFNQLDTLEEAFRWGQVTHLVANKQGLYTPAAAAQNWNGIKNSKVLQASVSILSAENFSTMGRYADAAAMLDQGARVLGRREMQAGRIGARFNWETARVAFGTGKLPAGNAALALCMAFQKLGSERLYQIALADALYTSGQIRVDRIAEQLYDDVLREPTAADWLVDPMETMTVVTTPHLGPMEHWFEVAVKRKQPEKAADVADRIRRHRFFSTIPTGGRMLALRWIVEAPEQALPDRARLERRDLLAKYPKLAELGKQAAALREKIAALPKTPADEKAVKEQTDLFGQLAAISTLQELLLSEIALRREPSDFVFPPLTSVKDLQKRLRGDQLVLAYFTTSRYVVGFAISKEACRMWQINGTAQIKDDMAALFKAWGLIDKNTLVATADLKKTEWKAIAARLLTQLTNGAKAEHFANFKELIVVPDGLVWYLPFEALQTGESSDMEALLSRMRVRYAPTLGLALPDERTMPAAPATAVVVGRMFAKEEESVPKDAAAELAKKLPGTFVVPANLATPGSLYGAVIDRLVVYDDIDDADRGSYDWSPLRSDKGKPAGALAQWALLPWHGPQQVVLPGFHTPVEAGLKRGGSGDEIFLSVMGLLASGSRTVLISRWRTGGQTGYDLMREFVQELPHTSASNAWQRASQLLLTTPLDLTREPRVRATPDDALTGAHPFFWAGYLLIDTGVEPEAKEP